VKIFLGVLMGILAGMYLSALGTFARRSPANVGPRPVRIQRQLEILEAEMKLVTRHA
jgi:hypothetical protein